jgi:hypothetical protein
MEVVLIQEFKDCIISIKYGCKTILKIDLAYESTYRIKTVYANQGDVIKKAIEYFV